MSYKRPVHSLHNSPQQSCVNNLTRAHDQIRPHPTVFRIQSQPPEIIDDT